MHTIIAYNLHAAFVYIGLHPNMKKTTTSSKPSQAKSGLDSVSSIKMRFQLKVTTIVSKICDEVVNTVNSRGEMEN
jgi:hypothetical protein